jgi:hypothetical protein
VPRQHREPHQQGKQVGEDDPLLEQVPLQTEPPRLAVEVAKRELVGNHGREPEQRDRERAMVEDRHA